MQKSEVLDSAAKRENPNNKDKLYLYQVLPRDRAQPGPDSTR